MQQAIFIADVRIGIGTLKKCEISGNTSQHVGQILCRR